MRGGLRSSLAGALLVATLAACGSPESRAADLRERLDGASVLLVVVDSFAAAHATPYGYERDTTPALARMANDGIRFADVTTGSPSGFAAFVSLSSGESPEYIGADRPGATPDPDRPTMAEAFSRAGYATAAVSTHPAIRAELDHGRGFDEFHFIPRTPGEGVPAPVHASVEEWLARSEPFLGVVVLATPRPPRRPHAGRAEELLGYVPEEQAGSLEFLEELRRSGPAPKRTLAALDVYDATLRDVDHAIGRWLEALEPSERDRDTIFVVAGSTGQSVGQRGEFGSGRSLYQEQVAVPLVIRLPDAHLAGTRVFDPVALYDLYPTLADLLALDAPAFGSGMALTPLLSEDWLDRVHPVVARTTERPPRYTLRQGHFKLIARPERDGAERSLLQNLEKDPLETRDFGPQRPETVAELERELAGFRERASARGVRTGRLALSPALAAELEALGYALAASGGD